MMLKAIFRAIFGYEEKAVEPNYPRYCESMRKLLSSGRPYTISELQKTLKKRKGTVYHEMTELRRGGLVIAKDYDKSISANKYRITS
jgi:Mn-dependent DtxR family transcriptional regulator